MERILGPRSWGSSDFESLPDNLYLLPPSLQTGQTIDSKIDFKIDYSKKQTNMGLEINQTKLLKYYIKT